MTATITCDWCGEPINGHPDHPPSLRAGGLYEDSGRLICGRELHYHAERGDSESCLAQAIAMLRDRSEWAHKGDGSGLEWRLMPAARRTEDDGHTPVMEEWSERVEAGTALYRLDLCVKATDGLRQANLVTLEEVAGRSADEVRSINGVGPKSFRRLEEEFARLGLTFGSGEAS